VKHGHHVTLWCYEPIEDVPTHVKLADAETILPKSSITRHRQSGSLAVFSDRFRYHLLRRQSATWLDVDVLLLHPLDSTSPYLFGWETPTSICTAVMRLPSGSPVLEDLIGLADATLPVPGWWTPEQKLRQRLRGLIGRQRRAEDMNWGSLGPAAFTYFLERRNLAKFALPVETFYPIHWNNTALFFASPDAISTRLTDKNIGVHLWSSSSIRERRSESPPVNSWLAIMCERYAIKTVI
jgi:Alpha 1,4-glycosyltransferase conserved region